MVVHAAFCKLETPHQFLAEWLFILIIELRIMFIGTKRTQAATPSLIRI
jgi:hypothetical protein